MAFDPLLYAAFGAGILVGLVWKPTGPWVPRLTLATVFLLVGLLGASLDQVGTLALLEAIPVGVGFAGLLLGLTALAFALLRPLAPSPPRAPPPPQGRSPLPTSVFLLVALVVGFGIGRAVSLPTALAIPWALAALLALVAFGLRWSFTGLRRLWVPLTAASAGAVSAALLLSLVTGVAPTLTLASSLAFGWYTLAGPLVAARAGAALGLFAFLSNFFRENLTMVTAPIVGPALGGDGLTALGGATSMDTTLYFVTRYGDSDAGSLAVASGLILTVAASLLLPALLALPGA